MSEIEVINRCVPRFFWQKIFFSCLYTYHRCKKYQNAANWKSFGRELATNGKSRMKSKDETLPLKLKFGLWISKFEIRNLKYGNWNSKFEIRDEIQNLKLRHWNSECKIWNVTQFSTHTPVVGLSLSITSQDMYRIC